MPPQNWTERREEMKKLSDVQVSHPAWLRFALLSSLKRSHYITATLKVCSGHIIEVTVLFFRFKIGARFTGNYLDGKKNGEGVFLYPDGSKYEGSWINDLREGWGTYTYPNGDTYEGEWYQGRRHGQGVYTYKETGSRYDGTWFHGRMQDRGHLIHSNHRFVGIFEEDKPKGPGKYVFDAGCEQLGRYVWKEEESMRENEEDEAETLVKAMWEGKEICGVDEQKNMGVAT